MTERFAPILDLESEQTKLRDAIAVLRNERDAVGGDIARLKGAATILRTEVAALDEQSNLQSFGLYRPRFQFATSAEFDAKLERVWENQKRMVQEKAAATCTIEWTVNGSAKEGQKQINQTLRLMMRAFNGEADAAIARVKYNNVKVMETRINKAFTTINGLAAVQQCNISPQYLELKLQELFATHERQEMLQREREEQRRIREQMRDEEIARKQIEKARREAEADEEKCAVALDRARAEVEIASASEQERLRVRIAELERRLADAHESKERAVARAQLTRSGHVYVISNIGSFGEHVYKIGMTRRLDPQERIRELGDASVPFDFDVHAVIYAEDAPALEYQLHRAFAGRRVNRVNERKEFFKVSIEEIAAEVKRHNAEIAFTLAAEAEDYRKTLAALEEAGTERLQVS